MASSLTVSSQGSQKYDVFLNFRGEDVRFKLLGYLIFALNQASLNIFVDYKLKRGEHIKSALMDAIQDSKVSLTIFSEGYASSAWSLDELVKIMECRENPMLRQKVIPVFYHVTASDVRNQSGVFAEDFAKHESDYGSRSKVPLWRAAMAAAGCLSGRSVKKTSPEVDVTMQIVNDVLEILGRKPLEISSGKLKDCSNIQQQQGNGSIWTVSTRQGIHVEDLNTVLMSIEVQVGGKPSETQFSQISETSSSHPSPPISYSSRTTLRMPMASTATPTKSTLNNSSLGSGGGNNISGVNSYGLGSTMVPTSSGTQVGLPMSSSSFASGGGNNTNGSGLGSSTVPYSSVSRPGMSMATTPTMPTPGYGGVPSGFGADPTFAHSAKLGNFDSNQRSDTSSSHPSPPISYRSRTWMPMASTATPTNSTLNNSSLGSGGGNYRSGVNSYGLGSTMVPASSGTQAGLPMSSSSFTSGGGNNTYGSGLASNTAPYSSVSGLGISMATTPTMPTPGFGRVPSGFGTDPTFAHFAKSAKLGNFDHLPSPDCPCPLCSNKTL